MRGSIRSPSEDQARAIADRKTGIGCDQLIVMENSSLADVRMRIWNAEGGEVESPVAMPRAASPTS